MNGIDDENQKIIEIKEVLSELPTEHSQNIAALFKILCKVEALSEHNKMTIDNLIVVVGPNLLWDDSKVQTCKQCLAMCGIERVQYDTQRRHLLSVFERPFMCVVYCLYI